MGCPLVRLECGDQSIEMTGNVMLKRWNTTFILLLKSSKATGQPMILSMRSRILKLKFSFFHYPLISDPSFKAKKVKRFFLLSISLDYTKNKQANNPTQGPSLPGYFHNVKLLRLHIKKKPSY
jgi:hypothetical protein